MVKENGLLKRNYWIYPYVTYIFWTQMCVCLKMSVTYIYNMSYIFFNNRVLKPLMKIYVFSIGWKVKHDLFLRIVVHSFFHPLVFT